MRLVLADAEAEVEHFAAEWLTSVMPGSYSTALRTPATRSSSVARQGMTP
jgi:hypothetical protein